MKKIWRLISVLMMVMLLSTVVSASDMDFSGKSMEDLLDVRNAVDEAIFETGEAVVIEQGKYTGGKDIAIGSYILKVYGEGRNNIIVYVWKSASLEDEYRSAWNEYWNQYNAYEADNALEKPTQPSDGDYADICEKYVYAGESLKINIEEGYVLDIRIPSYYEIKGMTIEKASGLFMD